MAGESPFLKPSSLTPQRQRQLRELNELARERGQSLARMALAWVLSHPQITSVLVGASRSSQILDNLGCLEHPEFTPQEQARIEEILSEKE